MRDTLNRFLRKYFEKFNSRKFKASLILTWIGITCLFGYQLQFLEVDFEFEKFFPSSDPDITFYQDHLKKFTYDNDYLILILENDPGVFQNNFLQRVRLLSNSLRNLQHVDQVISPTDIRHLIKSPMGITPIPLIHIDDPEKYASDSTRIFSHPIYSSFFAKNGQSLMIQVIHDHIQDPVGAELLVQEVYRLLDTFEFEHHRIAGKLVAQKAFIRLIQRDFSLFLVAALLLSFMLLVMIFRSLKIALLPYLISLTTLIWLLGTMAMLNEPITILGSLIPPVILFVSTSDAIHLINSFRDNHNEQFTERLNAAVRKVFIPTLLTSITTAIGFFSLISINTAPIQKLGIFTGIGVLTAFLVTYVFGPLLIKQTYPANEPSLRQKHLALWVLKHPKSIFTSTILILILSVTGITFLKTDAYLLQDLPENSRVREHFNFVDEFYGGSKPWELAYWPADTSKTIWHEEVMAEANKIHGYLQNDYPIELLWSPVTLINYGNQVTRGGNNRAFHYPEEENYQNAVTTIRRFSERNELPELISKNQKYARFAGYIPEMGSYQTIKKDKELLSFIHQHIDNNIINYRLTGTTYLIDKSHELLSANLFKGLLIAVIMISIILGVYFRSFKILFISIIPNIVPLLVTAGFMGWMGISLKLTTSIIFAVAFGIAVDDTIHFLAIYKKQKNKNRVLNMISTFQSAGKSIVVTSLIIVAGFSLFTFSSFGATYFLGLFLCLSLAVAVLSDLTILPLLLHFASKKNNTH